MLPLHADPDEVIRRTTPLLIVVHNAFESAAIRSLDFFKPKRSRGKRGPIDPQTVNSSLYSALVRYYVMLALNEKGYAASEEEHEQEREGIDPQDVPYDLDNLPNNGLLLKYANCQLRIRKKYYGRLPNAATPAMQEFYQQSFEFVDESEELRKLNLMILWNRDSHFRFSGLDLVLPTDGSPKFAEWEWRRKIPHPALLINGRTTEVEEDEPGYEKRKTKKTDTGTDD